MIVALTQKSRRAREFMFPPTQLKLGRIFGAKKQLGRSANITSRIT